jgi:hypothetical protein
MTVKQLKDKLAELADTDEVLWKDSRSSECYDIQVRVIEFKDKWHPSQVIIQSQMDES